MAKPVKKTEKQRKTKNKGETYKYYWIKVSTEAQLAAFRDQMREAGEAASKGTKASGATNASLLSGAGTDNVIVPPLQPYLAVESSYRPDNVIVPPLRILSQEVSPDDKKSRRLNKADRQARLTLGFVISPAYANRKGIMLDRYPMPDGYTIEQAKNWIEGEGKLWAGDAFCILAYVAATEE